MNLSFGTPWRCTVLCSFVNRLRQNKLWRSFYWSERSKNRKECYWTLCTVTFAKTWTKQTIPNEQRRFWATHVNRNNLQSRFPSSLFVWEVKRKVSSPFPSADLHPFCEERTPHRRLQPEVSPFPFKYTLTLPNRPLPNSEDPHFQNEARCTTFLVKMSFICMRVKMISISKAEHLPSFWNRGPGQLGNGLLVSLSVFSLIEAICLKILAKPLHKNTKQLLPTDVLHSKSPLARVPIVARVSWMYLVYILLNWSQLSAIHYSNKWLSQRCFLFSEQRGRLFLIFQGTQGTE